jgi:hypothetical protein
VLLEEFQRYMRKPVLFGYFWGLLVMDADLGTRLTSDSHSASQGYCRRSFTKDKGIKLLGYLSC